MLLENSLQVCGELTEDEATEILLSKGFDLQGKILKYERSMIKQALAQANGRITHAASLLRLSYQGLAYIIQSRHRIYSRNALRCAAVRERPETKTGWLYGLHLNL